MSDKPFICCRVGIPGFWGLPQEASGDHWTVSCTVAPSASAPGDVTEQSFAAAELFHEVQL